MEERVLECVEIDALDGADTFLLLWSTRIVFELLTGADGTRRAAALGLHGWCEKGTAASLMLSPWEKCS